MVGSAPKKSFARLGTSFRKVRASVAGAGCREMPARTTGQGAAFMDSLGPSFPGEHLLSLPPLKPCRLPLRRASGAARARALPGPLIQVVVRAAPGLKEMNPAGVMRFKP